MATTSSISPAWDEARSKGDWDAAEKLIRGLFDTFYSLQGKHWALREAVEETIQDLQEALGEEIAEDASDIPAGP